MIFDVESLKKSKVATGKVEQALRPVLNLIFYHFNWSEPLLKFHHVFSYL